jgi:hypothetical protein
MLISLHDKVSAVSIIVGTDHSRREIVWGRRVFSHYQAADSGHEMHLTVLVAIATRFSLLHTHSASLTNSMGQTETASLLNLSTDRLGVCLASDVRIYCSGKKS